MASKQGAGDSYAANSGTEKTTASSVTPFQLAAGDFDTSYDGIPYDCDEQHIQKHTQQANRERPRFVRHSSHLSVDSMTDGIDILGVGDSPSNFLQWTQQQTGRIVTNRRVRRGVLALILLNSLLLGAATLNIVRENAGWNSFLDGSIYLIQVLFTIEVLVEIGHYQRRTLQQGWLLFDILIVTTSWLVLPSLTVLRAFRLIRALRKASGVAQVKQLIKALLKVIPKMLAIVFIMLLLFYIFAVLFTGMFQDLYNNNNDNDAVSQDYFGRIDKSAFTLFQIMTLDNWAAITDELTAVYPWAWFPVISFIIVATFFFGALVIAVVTEAVSSVGNERLWKTLEVRESQSDRLLGLAGLDGVGVGSGSGAPVDRKTLRRLEEKVDNLRTTIDQLVRMQVDMQEAIVRMQQQEMTKGLTQGQGAKLEKKNDKAS